MVFMLLGCWGRSCKCQVPTTPHPSTPQSLALVLPSRAPRHRSQTLDWSHCPTPTSSQYLNKLTPLTGDRYVVATDLTHDVHHRKLGPPLIISRRAPLSGTAHALLRSFLLVGTSWSPGPPVCPLKKRAKHTAAKKKKGKKRKDSV